MKSILLYLYKSNTHVNINFCWESWCICEKYNFKNDKRTTIWFGCTCACEEKKGRGGQGNEKLSNEDCLFIILRSQKCSHLNYIFSSSDVSLSPFMFERHYIAHFKNDKRTTIWFGCTCVCEEKNGGARQWAIL
jgi:hypothetical protein